MTILQIIKIIITLELAGQQKREEREMKTQKTRVSNSPQKLRLLETSQLKFRRYQKKIRKYVSVTLKLTYETQVKTRFRPRLSARRGKKCSPVGPTSLSTKKREKVYWRMCRIYGQTVPHPNKP
jgi:hypothetical protein